MNKRHVCLPALLLSLAILLTTGCQEVRKDRFVTLAPTESPFSFLERDPLLGDKLGALYTQTPKPIQLSVYISDPVGHEITFDGAGEEPILQAEGKVTYAMPEGLYPFRITNPDDENQGLSGAIAVFNLDKTVELATFGHKEETKVFNAAWVEKAALGVLASYTISFDGKPRLVYWLGNRVRTFHGGEPTVELNFTSNEGLEQIRIEGKEVEDKIATLAAYEFAVDDTGTVRATPKEYEFTMVYTNGDRFRGYIRGLKDNAFTAFMSIPCTIPAELLSAAQGGTISKFTIYSGDNAQQTGDGGEADGTQAASDEMQKAKDPENTPQRDAVAELVFGRGR